MPKLADELERHSQRVDLPPGGFERLARRRDRRQRNRRIGAAVLAIVIVSALAVGFASSFDTSEPAGAPSSTPDPFPPVGGWIAYSHDGVLSAMNPVDPQTSLKLAVTPDTPLAWSADGSELLLQQHGSLTGCCGNGLSVLHADGTITSVVHVGGDGGVSGSLSPDGTKVAYTTGKWIYMVDVNGGTPRRLIEVTPIPHLDIGMEWVAFSPDGSRLAYFCGEGDHDNALWVANADGTSAHVVVSRAKMGPSAGTRFLSWSPDGSLLMYQESYDYNIYTVGADGSNLTRIVRQGTHPAWSPGGSAISYTFTSFGAGEGDIEIANPDGSDARDAGISGISGPWTPHIRVATKS